MSSTPPRRRTSLHGAIATAALPVITIAGIGVVAAPAQAAPGPAGKAPSARNIADAQVRIATTLQARKVTSDLTVTVRSGDSVWSLANRHKVSVASVLKLNKLRSDSLIHPGDRLVLRRAAAPAASVPVKTQTPSRPTAAAARTHTVKSGDTLSGIAHRYNVSLSTLLRLNKLKATTLIYPGQRLTLSAATAAKPTSSGTANTTQSAQASSGSKSYTIRAGDTLSGIAARAGVSLSSLLSANGLKSTSVIYVGRTLKLPGTALASKPASTGSIPNTFLHYTYSAATNKSANANKAKLNAMSVPSTSQMRSIITATAKRMGVDPELAVAHALVESGLNARAVSPANALGAMQVVPATGEWMGQRLGRKLNLLDPYDNATAGVAYISYLQRNASSVDQGIAAYYRGLAGVKRDGIKGDVADYVRKVRAQM